MPQYVTTAKRLALVSNDATVLNIAQTIVVEYAMTRAHNARHAAIVESLCNQKRQARA